DPGSAQSAGGSDHGAHAAAPARLRVPAGRARPRAAGRRPVRPGPSAARPRAAGRHPAQPHRRGPRRARGGGGAAADPGATCRDRPRGLPGPGRGRPPRRSEARPARDHPCAARHRSAWRALGALLLRILARRAATVLAASPARAADARHAGAKHVQHAIIPAPHGTGGPAARVTAPPSKASAAGDTFDILVIARLAPQKGLESLLDAAALLAVEQPPLRLLVAGDGPLP